MTKVASSPSPSSLPFVVAIVFAYTIRLPDEWVQLVLLLRNILLAIFMVRQGFSCATIRTNLIVYTYAISRENDVCVCVCPFTEWKWNKDTEWIYIACNADHAEHNILCIIRFYYYVRLAVWFCCLNCVVAVCHFTFIHKTTHHISQICHLPSAANEVTSEIDIIQIRTLCTIWHCGKSVHHHPSCDNDKCPWLWD